MVAAYGVERDEQEVFGWVGGAGLRQEHEQNREPGSETPARCRWSFRIRSCCSSRPLPSPNVIDFSVVRNAGTPFETAPRTAPPQDERLVGLVFTQKTIPLALRRPPLAAVSKGRLPLAMPQLDDIVPSPPPLRDCRQMRDGSPGNGIPRLSCSKVG
jgi:hypothetical protein